MAGAQCGWTVWLAMKAKGVPALRSKRGLHRGSGAEPLWVGLAPQNTQEKKADTMKTYLLKISIAVEAKAQLEVFAKEEEKMKRRKLARLQHMATSLNYQLVPIQ
jgi:hypothetical protein